MGALDPNALHRKGTLMRREAPDADDPETEAPKSRRKVTKRALMVLGASLLLQPAGGSPAAAKHRKHWPPQDRGAASNLAREKRQAGLRRKLAMTKRAGGGVPK